MELPFKNLKAGKSEKKMDKSLLRITLGSFEEAIDLQDAIVGALRGNGMNVDLSENAAIENMEIGGFLDAALSVIGDKKVRAALFECAGRAEYNNQKINIDFFENNRELYYPIMIEILKANVGPFVGGLISSLSEAGVNLENFQKQK
jgi:hypothetical protein